MYKKIIFGLLFLLIICLCGCDNQIDDNPLKSLIDSFNDDKLDFKLYYYGKRENLSELKVTYISSISEIPFSNTHKNTFIIINNLDGQLFFDTEELLELKENIEKYRYSFYYFGNTEIENFYQSGLLNQEMLDPSALSFGYVREGDRYINSIGTWDVTANQIVKENDLLFLELVLNEFKYQININI